MAFVARFVYADAGIHQQQRELQLCLNWCIVQLPADLYAPGTFHHLSICLDTHVLSNTHWW